MTESLQSILNKLSFSDGIVTWIPYDSCHNVISHFTQEQWSMIMEYVSNEKEFRSYLQELKDVTACYLLKNITTNHNIAFCLINLTDSRKNIVSFHGGFWGKGISSLNLFHGVDLMLHTLINMGLNVRSQCLKENVRAERFIRAAGFKCYRRDSKYVYFYLPKNFSSFFNKF